MVLSALALAVMAVAGCGGGKHQAIEDPQRRHIMQMASIYRAYLTAHDNKPPASTEALKEWALKQPKDKLGIQDSVEDALKSPRDGEPYGFIPPPKQKRGPQTVQVYEKVGVKGNHITAGEMGALSELTDKELEQMLPR
jgi:hypothetical protein